MPKPQPDIDIMKLSVEIVKSALGTQGTWVSHPDRVATLLETVAHKIADLMYTPRG